MARPACWPASCLQTTDTFYVLIFLLSQSFSAPFDFNASLSLPLISPIITLEQPQVAFLLHVTMTPILQDLWWWCSPRYPARRGIRAGARLWLRLAPPLPSASALLCVHGRWALCALTIFFFFFQIKVRYSIFKKDKNYTHSDKNCTQELSE